MMKIKKVLAATLLATSITSCTKPKLAPSTWADIAATIPADVEYVVSINPVSETDTVLRHVVGGDVEVLKLVDIGAGLCTKKPDHYVVVGTPKAIFVTWPLPNPTMVADNVAQWPRVSLNNSVDARAKIVGDAALIVSDAQAWVVNSKKGVDHLNSLLNGALSGKAADVPALLNCISECPVQAAGVVPVGDKFVSVTLTHDEGRMKFDFNATDKSGKPVRFMSESGRLETGYLNELSASAPFVAVDVEQGKLPDLLADLVKLSGSAKAKIALRTIAPVFAKATGPVVIRLDSDELQIVIGFTGESATRTARNKLADLAKRYDVGATFAVRQGKLVISTPSPGFVAGLETGCATPYRHTVMEGPSAVGYARFVVDEMPVNLFLEVGDSDGVFEIEYPAGRIDTQMLGDFIKSLIPKQW